MPRIEVDTGALGGGGADGRLIAGRLTELRGELDASGSDAGAAAAAAGAVAEEAATVVLQLGVGVAFRSAARALGLVVRVVLQRDGSELGYHITTAFPTP